MGNYEQVDNPVVEVPITYQQSGGESTEASGAPVSSSQTFANLQADTYFEQPKYCCGKSRYPIHVFSMVLNVSLILAIIGVGLTAVFSNNHFLWIGVILLWIVYWIEALGVSSTCKYLRHIKYGEDILAYLHGLRSTAPVLWLHAVCYHYETRTRLVNKTTSHTESYYDSATGQQQTRTVNKTEPVVENYEEKVVTYNRRKVIKIRQWNDVSGELESSYVNFPILKLDLTKAVQFSDSHSEHKYTKKRDKFRNKCIGRDVHLDFTEGTDIEGFKDRIMSVQPGVKASKLMSLPVYLIATFFLLSWPYRLWLDRRCTHSRVLIRKVVNLSKKHQMPTY